ncbi:MAG: CapA family protein, partial [Gaiellaceae bacterium]
MKRAVVLLTLPALLAVSAVLLVIELTSSDEPSPQPGALISSASAQAASSSALAPTSSSSSAPTESDEAASPEATDRKKKNKKKKKKQKKPKKPKKRKAPPPLPDVEGAVTISAVGDIVMGTPLFGFPPEEGKTFFDAVEPLLDGDLVLGNLEGTLSSGGVPRCNAEAKNCFSFQTPPSYARWLSKAGFTTLNLANNHAYDFGAGALEQTRAALRQRGLRHTGAPGQITVHRVGKIRIAVVGFSTYRWSADLRDIDAASKLIKEAGRHGHVVVVTMHAGAEGAQHTHVRRGVERFLGQNRGDPVRFAHAAVDAGADLVVGHGPHVLR